MVEKDYVMRLISDIVKALAKTFLGKETVIYELPLEDLTLSGQDKVYQQMMELLAQGDICGAEDMLFDNIDAASDSWYEIALVFYSKVNEYDEDYLEEHNYSREEIKQGLKEVTKLCGHGEIGDMLIGN